MNITVHLNDYSLCDDYSGEYTIDIIIYIVNIKNKIIYLIK